jgi:hypothetical protein
MPVPVAPDGSDGTGGGRKRAIAIIAGSAAVAAAVLGATACAAPSTGNSGQASLSGASRQAAAVTSAGLAPSAGASAATASVPAAMKPETAPKAASTGPTPSAASPRHHPKPPVPVTSPASFSPATSPAGSPATSAPAAGAASSAPSTGPAPSEPAVSGSPGHGLSVSRSCAAQVTVLEEQEFSCSFTRTGGDPDILYAVNVYVNGNLALEAGSTPAGLTFTGTNDDQVFTIGGEPEQPGTYTLMVEDYSGSTSASASFTLVVNQDPNLKRLP